MGVTNSIRNPGSCNTKGECMAQYNQYYYFEKAGPEVVNEVNQETLDVGAVLILISHDHQATVAQFLD